MIRNQKFIIIQVVTANQSKVVNEAKSHTSIFVTHVMGPGADRYI